MRVLALVAALLFATALSAQQYPGKPIKIVVGYPPGGSGDFTTRLIADEIRAEGPMWERVIRDCGAKIE